MLPGTDFNHNRDKLFFFWSQDLLGRDRSGRFEPAPDADRARACRATSRRRSTARTGCVFISDPLLAGTCCNVTTGGPACFPGNVIPENRIDPIRQALMNLFPLPNATDPTGTNQYNYTYQNVQDRPRNDQVLRIDWNVSRNTTFYARVQYGYEETRRRRLVPGFDRSGLAAAAEQSTRSTPVSDCGHACCTRSTSRPSWK